MKTKGYVSVYTLIVFMLLTGIITVLILGLRFESKKAINKEAYYQNVLIARSVYYRIKKDERFLEFMKDPRNNKDKSISIEDLGLECYNEKIPVKLQKTTRGYVLTYKIDYKGTTTFSSINFKETSSPLFNEFSVVKTDEEDIEMLLDNSLEKIEGDLVFYQDEKDLYYLKQEEYQRLIEEFTRVDSEINEEKRDDEGLEIDQEPKIIDEKPEEIDIRDYLNHFNKIEGEYFYILENFKVLSKENPKLKGICQLKQEGEKEGKLDFQGLLINYSGYGDVKVKGKVIEVEKYQGDCKLDLNIVQGLRAFTKLDDSPQILGFFIK
mgnify:CR=1 FL=1